MSSLIRQAHGTLQVNTSGKSMMDVTHQIDNFLANNKVQDGLITILIKHTSASLMIQENADPDVQRDMLDALSRLAPENADYHHSAEGPDDMPSHIKASLTDCSLSIPVRNGAMDLGTWQGIYIVEHRAMAHCRTLSLCYQGT